MSSEAQISANRANGKLSTGPATPEGKAKSSLNAVKTGLTGRTVLLPSDDAVAYQKHVERFFNQYKPVGDEEASLAQSLADTEWRLLRIPSLELGIYALGCLEFASKFEHEDPAIQSALLDAYVFQTHQKQLNNLSVQEARLRKHRETDAAELHRLQHQRKKHADSQKLMAINLYEDAQKADLPFDPAEFGFEFSTADIKAFVAARLKQARINNRSYFHHKQAA
jgi:hypothetical protein